MKTERAFVTLRALLPATLLVACGGSSDFTSQTKTSDTGIALDDLPAAYAAAQCELVARCYGPVYHVFFAVEDCETLLEQQIRDSFGAIEHAVDAKTVTYDGKKAAQCLDILSNRDCGEVNQRSIDECEAAFTGTVEPNGECNIDDECVGSRICEVAAACPGKCVDRYDAGHACNDNDECADGLVCSEATERCVAPAADGEACGGGIEPQCDGGLLCAGDDKNAGRTGTCHPTEEITAHGAGETCSPTVGELCEEGLSCVVDSLAPSFSCRSMPASGGSCGIGFPENCPHGEYCPLTTAELVAGTFASHCLPLPQEGEPCAMRPDNIGTLCEAYTRCDASTGMCLGLRGLGESCSADELCLSGHCENGGCASPRVCQ